MPMQESTTSRSTTISNTIELAKDKMRYDNAAKKLLSEKIILAWIMNQCIAEYQGMSVEEIATKYINGTPQISNIPVEQDVEAPRIQSGDTEDASINEGVVTYDIRFNAFVPTKDGIIRLIINLEAQNDFYPGYSLVTRGIYYDCRMISAQSGTVFYNDQYENIQKVYSIWICTNPPQKRENTITSYRIVENNVVGAVQEKVEHYDLLHVMMICLGNSEDVDNDILRLLDILLKDETSVEVKKRKLEEDFQIPMTQEIEQGVKHMCNLSDGIEQRGIERGEMRKLVSQVMVKVRKSKSLEMIADELECEVEEIRVMYEVIQRWGMGCSVDDVVKELQKPGE